MTDAVPGVNKIPSVKSTERLRVLLARERPGADFEDAWTRATALVLAECDWTRETWHEIFEWGGPSWQRAYEGRPRNAMDWLQPPDPEPRDTPRYRIELIA